MQFAYGELDIAANATPTQIRALGDIGVLTRPWDPASCISRGLREEVWAWLDAVVTWLNHEYVWDAADMIPSCWPYHPHLVHDIAALADQRRLADLAVSSDRLEDWYRYCLPSFTDRLRSRTKVHCDNGHQPWPANGRHTRHLSATSQGRRQVAFTADAANTNRLARPAQPFGVVNLDTGEITEP